LFGIIPAVGSTIVLYRPFSVAIFLVTFLSNFLLLGLLGGGTVKIVTVGNCYIYLLLLLSSSSSS
jgi:hypothetical protein